MAISNDLWVLQLLLTLAEKLVPGFKRDTGARRGARRWNESAQAELIADVEAVKAKSEKKLRRQRSLSPLGDVVAVQQRDMAKTQRSKSNPHESGRLP